jgi:CHAT domain-containing protein
LWSRIWAVSLWEGEPIPHFRYGGWALALDAWRAFVRRGFLTGFALLLASIPACRSSAPRDPAREAYSPAHAYLLCLLDHFEGRLSGPRCPILHKPPSKLETRKFLAVARRIDSDLSRERTAPHLAAAGVLRLLDGRRDQAIPLLEEAQTASPLDPRIANDLAVALLASPGDSDPMNILRSFDLLSQPFPAQSSMPWLHYNQALVYERVGLAQIAVPILETALNEETDAGWREIIRRRMEELRREEAAETWSQARQRLLAAAERQEQPRVEELIRRWTQASHEVLEEEVLGGWGQDVLAGNAVDAARKLKAARCMAEALMRLGDRFVADALPSNNSLAGAHRDYRDARRAQLSGNYEVAEERARAAADGFRRWGSPFADIADRVVSTCRYHRGEIKLALADSERALLQPAILRYPSVAGRWQWLRGICLVTLGRPDEGLEAYSQARYQFEALGDTEGVALSDTFSGETFRNLGQAAEAAESLFRALRLFSRLLDRPRLQLAPSELAALCVNLRLPRAALAFQEFTLKQARASGLDYAEGYELMVRARIELLAGSPDAAASDIAQARLLWAKTEPGALHDRMLADLEVAEGGLWLTSNPPAAVHAFESALRYFESVGRTFQPLAVRYQLARALVAQGRTVEAKSSLERGLASRETLRAALQSESQRERFFDEAQAFFDDFVRVSFRTGDIEAAFDAAERSRSRVLLDRLAGDTPLVAVNAAPPSLEEIRRRLPPATALIEFHFDSDRVRAIWVGTAGATGKDLASRREITSALSVLENRRYDEAAVREALATLYDLLLRPFEAQLANSERLILVPHRELFGIPFAALYNRRTERYLIEREVLTIAPSAAIALPQALPRSSVGGASKLLVFADPKLDERDSRLAFPRLSRAHAEATLVAAQYQTAVIREDADARIDRFLREAGRFEIVHVAAHGAENRLQPGRSFLALARGEKGEPGLLTAEAISGAGFAKTRIVVLATCEGGGGEMTGSEGTLSVARAFLAAGVPAVVASFLTIGDRTAESLFSAFHRRLATGEAPAEALREAQLELLRGADLQLRSPLQWGSVQFIGRSAAIIRR